MHPPPKRRKLDASKVEEVAFDTAARQEYLTGFHKRKLQRARHARGIAEKKARLREERKQDLERHLAEVNASMRLQDQAVNEAGWADDPAEEEQWSGISEPEPVDHDAEYIDEHRYTTVTVEEMDVSRAGLREAEEESQSEHKGADKILPEDEGSDVQHAKKEKWKWTKEKPKKEDQAPRKKIKKFRYENKAERKVTRIKESSKNRKQAVARRGG